VEKIDHGQGRRQDHGQGRRQKNFQVGQRKTQGQK